MLRQTNKLNMMLLMALIYLLSACTPSTPDGTILGTLERDRVLFTAMANEIITQIHVEVGDLVGVGDILVELDSTRANTRVAKANADLVQVQAQLTKLQNGARDEDVAAANARLRNAKADLTFQEKSLARTNTLFQQNSKSQADLDQANALYDAKLAAYQDVREQLLKLTNGSRPEDILQASAQVDAAQANLALMQQALSDLQVRATRAGRVEALPWNMGERPSLGSPVVVMLDETAPYARVYIPETYRSQLKVGDNLTVHVDGKAEHYRGVVSEIATEPSFTPYYGLSAKERARLVYLAQVQLPEQAKDLPSGLPIQVQLNG